MASLAATATPMTSASPQYGYDSGYAYPDAGSPSGDQPMARPVPEPPNGALTRTYLYPPSEGADAGNS